MIAFRPTALAGLLLVADNAIAATNLWWDTDYQARFNIAISTGPLPVDKGYNGYTARIATLNTQSLISAGVMRPDCSDLRIAYYDGLSWIELPRHVLGCNSPQTDVRFMLAADIPVSGQDDNYYLYHDNPAPGALPVMNETNVYLWFDDVQTNRIGSYTRGRVDAWHGSGWDDSLTFQGSAYLYDTDDNFTSGYRRAVDERDVYIEAEFRHERCYRLNITTGLLVRGRIDSGSGGSESSDNYYASNRGEFPNVGQSASCTSGGYTHDGSIVKNSRTNVVVPGPNPPDVIANQWRRQGLAAWSTGPTNLAFWDEDLTASWAALGFPSTANLQTQGTDGSSEISNRGFVAIMTAQDRATLRNILVRRFVIPEPSLTLTAETRSPVLVLTKSSLTVFDPVNLTSTSAKPIPGAWVEYSLTASNSGTGSPDADSLAVTEPVPANLALFVGDLTGPGSGPIEFVDGPGAAASGLTYVFGGLPDPNDSLEFSTDGVSYNYTPSPDVNGFDSLVRFVRVTPAGSFAAADNGTDREFTLRLRVRVQ